MRANDAGPRIEQGNVEHQTTKYDRLAETISALAEALGAVPDLPAVYRAVRDFTSLAVVSDSIFVSLYHEDRLERTADYCWGDGEEIDVSSLPPMPIGAGVNSEVILTRKPLVIDDYQRRMSGCPQVVVQTKRSDMMPRSALVVPMIAGGRVIGTVEIQSYRPAAYGAEHATVMQLAANLAAVAIENVRLLERERTARRRFLRLVDGLDAIVWEAEPTTRAITFINQHAEKILGHPTSAWLSDPAFWSTIVHPDDRERAGAQWDEAMLRGRDFAREYRMIAADGRVVWLHDAIQLDRGPDGSLESIRGVALDVTRRKQLELQLQQAQRMEAVGRLAGGVAHDFNNLLTVITGFADLASWRLSTADPLLADIGEIKSAASRAGDLTRQLLAFSRQQVLKPRVVDVNAIVSDMERMLGRLIGEDVVLETRLADGLPRVKVDPGQLSQVVANLAVNARDAMPQGGRLVIETSLELRRRETTGPLAQQVAIRVADTGAGMSEETLTHIFEPFFTTKEAGKGTGLGLSTVYGIVQQSNGSIEVDSRPGQGTTFTILLPACHEEEEAEAGASAGPDGAMGEVLLLVEDEDAVRRLGKTALEMRGYRVLEARGGGEALLLCERHAGKIDLLVTDVVMPGMSGRELADRLAVVRPEIKSLFVSGYTDDALDRHRVASGELNFLQKPYTPDSLARKVREVLDATG
jgi:PAS domain S-box-containing protein